jgi:hypothetical protein
MLEMADIFGYSFSEVMQIDNRELDGFAEHFKTHDCYHSSCDECGYCNRWAEKVVRVDKEKHEAILKKFDAFIEAIINRQTLTENILPDVSNIRLNPEAVSVLDRLMAFVPPPLAEIARMKIISGAAQRIPAPTEVLARRLWSLHSGWVRPKLHGSLFARDSNRWDCGSI